MSGGGVRPGAGVSEARAMKSGFVRGARELQARAGTHAAAVLIAPRELRARTGTHAAAVLIAPRELQASAGTHAATLTAPRVA
jgi:hypothetical protein